MKLSKETRNSAGSASLLPKLTFNSIVSKMKKPMSKFFKSHSNADNIVKKNKGNKFTGLRIDESILLQEIQAMKDNKASQAQSHQNIRFLRKGRLKNILDNRCNYKSTKKPQAFCCSIAGKNICTPTLDELSRSRASASPIKEIAPFRTELLNETKVKLPKINSSNASHMLIKSYLPTVDYKQPIRISKSKLISKENQISTKPRLLPTDLPPVSATALSTPIIIKKKPDISIPDFISKYRRTSLPFSMKMKRPDSHQSEYPSPLSPFGFGDQDNEDSSERTLQFSCKNNNSMF